MHIDESGIEQITNFIRSCSEVQLESIYYYIHKIDKVFEKEDPMKGKLLREWMETDYKVINDKTLEARMKVRWEMLNKNGVIFGGILATFCDNVMGVAIDKLYPEKYKRSATIELNIHYTSPARGDILIAEVRMLQAGNSICILECYVCDENRNLVSQSVGTFKITK